MPRQLERVKVQRRVAPNVVVAGLEANTLVASCFSFWNTNQTNKLVVGIALFRIAAGAGSKERSFFHRLLLLSVVVVEHLLVCEGRGGEGDSDFRFIFS